MESQQLDSFGFNENELAFMVAEMNATKESDYGGVIMSLVGKHVFKRREYSVSDLVSVEEAVHAVETVTGVAVIDNCETRLTTHAFFSFRRADGWVCCHIVGGDMGTLYEFPIRELPLIYVTKEKVTMWDYPLSDPYWDKEAERHELVERITELQSELMERDLDH